jgi:hypothetical protein
VHIDFQPRPASPSSLRKLCALRVSALSLSPFFFRHSPPLCAHAGKLTTPAPSAVYFITRVHPRVGGLQPRRSSSVNPVHSALKPTSSVSPIDPLPLFPRPPLPAMAVTPLSATLTKKQGGGPQITHARWINILSTPAPHFQFSNLQPRNPHQPRAANSVLATSHSSLATSSFYPIKADLTPLSATLTKNMGEGANSASGPPRVFLPGLTASSVRLPAPEFFSLRSQQTISCERMAVGPVAAGVSPLSATLTKNQGGPIAQIAVLSQPLPMSIGRQRTTTGDY